MLDKMLILRTEKGKGREVGGKLETEREKDR